MIAGDRASARHAQPAHRLGRIARALGLAVAGLVRTVLAPLVRARTVVGAEVVPGAEVAPGVAARPVAFQGGTAAKHARELSDLLALAEVEVVEVEPEFGEPLYATVFERLQRGPGSKLLDLRSMRVVKVTLFERMASAWQAARGTVPRLGILLDYERWIVLRNVAARRLRPIHDRGVQVEIFYAQQVDSLPGWFARGEVPHDRLREVIDWLRTQWRPGAIWPMVLIRTASMVKGSADAEAVPEMLLELAAIARSFPGTEGAEQAVHHGRAALAWVGDQPSRVRCRALRTVAAASLAAGKTAAGLVLLESAITTAAVLRDPIEEASALAAIGLHALQCGHHARAEARFRAALALLTDDDPAYLRATLHHDLALTLLEQRKDAEQAEQHATTALGLRRDRRSHLASKDIALITRIRAQRASSPS